MSKKKKNKTHQKALKDHKREGKKFIPPLMQLQLNEISWVNRILPEVIWMGILNEKYGINRGVDLSVTIAQTAHEIFKGKPSPNFAFNSSYSILNKAQKSELLENLKAKNCLTELEHALNGFLHLYPESSLSFLIETKNEENISLLEPFKITLANHFIKDEQAATLLQANIIYIAIKCDRLKIVKSLNLDILVSDFYSELGKQEASYIRSIAILLSYQERIDERWAEYFWNRGLEIDKCKLTI